MIATNLVSVDPATEENRLEAAADAPRSAPAMHGILVVDDEACVRGVLNAQLRRQGFAVWLAATGLEALNQYHRHGKFIDVVLMDVRMPGMDGPQTLAALRQINPEVCCVFMSGALGNYTEDDLRDLGAAAIFPKPFGLVYLGSLIRELASRALRERGKP